jgi:hypothetical protein
MFKVGEACSFFYIARFSIFVAFYAVKRGFFVGKIHRADEFTRSRTNETILGRFCFVY